MPAQLVALNEGPSILLDRPVLLVGRDVECDIRLDSRKISRRHCVIAQVRDNLVVRDLGSTNGIRINGTRVMYGQLGPGDELTIGNHRYKVRWDSLVLRGKPAPEKPQEKERAPEEELESYEEPVALPDAEDAPKALPKKNHDPDKPGEPPATPKILPEQIDLASASSIFPGGSPKPPSPH